MTDETWEQVANRLERIDFDALADDEKSAVPMTIVRTLDEMMTALTKGECSKKIGDRIIRVVSRLNKKIYEWQMLQRGHMPRRDDMGQRGTENAAPTVYSEQGNLPSIDNKLFLQQDGSVLFRDRSSTPSCLVTCRRNAGGWWEYNANDYGPAFKSYEELMAPADDPYPEPRWLVVDMVDLLINLGRLVEGSVSQEQLEKAEAYERKLRASWKRERRIARESRK